MQIRHEPSGENGRFTLGDGTAEMTYTRREDGTVVFDHTFVPKPERGRGIARRLVAAGVEWARGENLKVDPACPFAHAEFQHHGDWHDVLAH